VELDQPLLRVKYPSSVIGQRINKNDEIQIEVFYEEEVEKYFFALILTYQYEVVAVKAQNYTKFSFRIMDLFENFERRDSRILLRISLYDPNYFFPLYNSFTV
jgi:hypothetical protein